MGTLKRSSGVLLHITSLPNEKTLGTFSCECNHFIDWLADAGFSIWQVLPITDCGYGLSPYSASSSFAINPTFIDLTEFLSDEEIDSFDFNKAGDRVIEENKIFSALDLIYDKFGKTTDISAFEKKNKLWLDDYALFKVIKQTYKNISWTQLPTGLKNRVKTDLDAFKLKHADEIRKIKFLQFIANEQWQRIRDYASSKGIKLFGDVPFYVDLDSADVWANPKNWKLETTSKGEIAGVPPDYFNEEGQLWGNPIYNYTAMAKNKFKYFVDRFSRLGDLFDIVRIDHFTAFSKYWTIPYGSTSAKRGKWAKGYGKEILTELTKKLKISIVAEDLGIVTEEVTHLREQFKIPGLKVMQFAFDGEGDNMYQPHNWEKNCVAYIGTHDNNTFMGLLNNSDWDKINRFKRYLRIPLEWGNDAVVDNAIITMYRSSANTIIFTMQDILKLDSQARMNTPSQLEGNWLWQLEQLPSHDLCNWYMDLASLYCRR